MKKQRKFTRPEWLSFRWLKENIDATIIMLIACFVSVSLFVSWVSSIDWHKATNEDWSQLYQQADAIRNQQLETIVYDDSVNIEITIESDECKLILQKGEDNKFSEIIESDKAVTWYLAPVGAIIIAFISVIAGFVVLFLELAVYSIATALWKNKLKQKRGT